MSHSRDKGWAVVTGASAGIGQQFARELARRGHPVLAVARRAERLEALAHEAAAHGGRVEAVVADLETPEGVELVARRAEALGEVELLVNCAGFATWGHFLELRDDKELGSIRLNIEALVVLTRRLLPAMVRRGRGGVINVASSAAFQPMPYFTTYAATKAFVLSFSEALAQEMKGTGVRVLASCPGPVRTEFAAAADAQQIEDSLPPLTAEQVVRATLRAYDGGRVVRVVGLINRILVQLPRVLPRSVVRWMMAQFMRPRARPRLEAA